MTLSISRDRIGVWVLWVLASTVGILLGFGSCYLARAIANRRPCTGADTREQEWV